MDNTALSEIEKDILGFALFSYAMKAGPPEFSTVESIAAKVGVTNELVHYAADWINDGKNRSNEDTLNRAKNMLDPNSKE